MALADDVSRRQFSSSVRGLEFLHQVFLAVPGFDGAAQAGLWIGGATV
jgi:hypothetical protein